MEGVKNKTDCLAADSRNQWINRKYNFDDLGKALMSLFVLSSRDGWVNIMYTGLDAVGVDMQVIKKLYNWTGSFNLKVSFRLGQKSLGVLQNFVFIKFFGFD